MKKFIYYALSLALMAGTFSACSSDDDFNTDQYAWEGVHLNVFGPSPVARGGELRFLGTRMDQIIEVDIPGCEGITDIKEISNEEIRVTVPQTAEVGKVTLVHAGGKITTKTLLTYTEPISIESFSPMSLRPGEKLTIKGEYLNLIHEIIFTDGVAVGEEDFESHSRAEIVLTVPEEAQTGLIIISDGAPQLPNWIYSDEELAVTLPSVAAPLDLTNAKPGDVITVTGKDLDLVRKVCAPNGDEIDFTYADGKITFKLPDNISDGTIVMIPASGVKVAIANIGVVVPTELEAVPAEGLRAGSMLTIKGVNMQMVSTVSFPNVADPVKPMGISATEVRVIWPDAAQSGDVVLNLKSGKTVSVPVATAKPEVLAMTPNPVPAGGIVTFAGKNLDLVKSIKFGGGITLKFDNSDAAKFSINVPVTAESGELTLTMANGETVTTERLEIDAPQCAYITEVVSEELKGGDIMVVKIKNSDKLTGVNVNGAAVQYIVSGDKLYISLPQAAGKGTKVTLVSSNGEITYTYDVTPATHVENVIWSGAWENPAWAGLQDLAYGGFDWSTVPAGSKLTLYMTPTVDAGSWWCVSLRHGDGWANLPGNVGSQIDMPADGIATIVLTREILDDLIANMGLIVTGQNYILTKIVISYEISLETDVKLAEMPIVLSAWENHEVGPGLAFVDAGIQVGQKLRFYTETTGDTPMIQIFDGHWGAWNWPEIGNTQQFNSDNCAFGVIELNVTQDVYNKLTTFTDWGYCIIFQGQNVTINRITLE